MENVLQKRGKGRDLRKDVLYVVHFMRKFKFQGFIEKLLAWVRNIKNYFSLGNLLKLANCQKNYFSLFSRTLNLNSMFVFMARQNSSTSRFTSS